MQYADFIGACGDLKNINEKFFLARPYSFLEKHEKNAVRILDKYYTDTHISVMENEQMYTMKAVAHKTGLSAHVIRAWEKRYQAIEPERTTTNRRLYSEREVRRLQLLRMATRAGHGIGRIAKLTDEALAELTRDEPPAPIMGARQVSAGTIEIAVEERLDNCLEAIAALDATNLDNILMSSSMTMSQPILVDQLIIPLIQRVGDYWRDGTFRIVHEHLASSALRTFLGNMRATFTIPESAPRMVVTTPGGQLHELGALIVSVVAASEGWQVTYLGPNLPAEEISAAVNKNKSRALALSLVYPMADARVVQELLKLRKFLPDETRVLVGGRAASSYSDVLAQIEAVVVEDIPTLRNLVESL